MISEGENRKPYILLVDDVNENIRILANILSSENYRIGAAKNGLIAVDMVEKYNPDLVLMDIMMPELDGFDACKLIKSNQKTRHIPILFITAMNEKENIVKGFQFGGSDYVTKPFEPEVLIQRVKNQVELSQLRSSLEIKVAQKISELEKANQIIQRNTQELLERLLMTAEYRDNETGNHIKRVSGYSQIIADSLGFKEKFIKQITEASKLHDIGKIGIPDNILLKPAKLTREEFELIKIHTIYGKKILEGLDNPLIEMARDIALSHHEHYDGTGYPYGIRNDCIPIAARIVSVADVFDALISERPYKPAWAFKKAQRYILKQTNKKFDPDIVDAFIKNSPRITKILEKLKD